MTPRSAPLFAASVIIWMRPKQQPDAEPQEEGPCHLWERVLLIRADGPDEAMRKATDFGARDAETNSVDLVDDDGNPAELLFMGVRKLREVDSPDPESKEEDVFEISASEMVVSNEADVTKLARGSAVIVQYVD